MKMLIHKVFVMKFEPLHIVVGCKIRLEEVENEMKFLIQ